MRGKMYFYKKWEKMGVMKYMRELNHIIIIATLKLTALFNVAKSWRT